MKQTGVYRIRCTASGKLYVGSAASSFDERWKEHCRDLRHNRHHCRRLQNAWNKYGPLYFVFEVVEITAPEHVVAVEQTFIDFWKSADKSHGFNTCPTAGSILGVKRSVATREKIAAALRGKPLSEERRSKIAASHLGMKASVEARQKMSLSRLGKTKSAETRAKIAASNRATKQAKRAITNQV